jgi:hypothetical protein
LCAGREGHAIICRGAGRVPLQSRIVLLSLLPPFCCSHSTPSRRSPPPASVLLLAGHPHTPPRGQPQRGAVGSFSSAAALARGSHRAPHPRGWMVQLIRQAPCCRPNRGERAASVFVDGLVPSGFTRAS